MVVPPPPIPTIDPPRKPPSEQVGRLRVRFAKTGEMALLSHLDLVRMLERALRRSQLPVSCTGGFHPLPRLQLAQCLLAAPFSRQPISPAGLQAQTPMG